MNLLTFVIALLTTTVATGGFLVATFSLELFGWSTVASAVLLGLFGAAALTRRIEARITQQDSA